MSREEEIDDDSEPVVIDNGTNMMKAGFGGDDAPRAVFPTITGKPRHKAIIVGMGQKDKYVGDEAIAKRGILTLKYPMEYGLIINWDDMQSVWHHTFYNELVVAPEEHSMLLTESALNSKENREKMTEIMFEIFNLPSMYIAGQAPLSLYQSGRTTGIVINSGYDITNIVPVYEGYVLREAVLQLNIGGDTLSRYLAKLLTERGYCFVHYWKCAQLINDIKIKKGYIAIDYQEEIKKKNDIGTKYQLPDGQEIQFDIERFKCCQPFFKPSLLGIESNGIHKLLYQSVTKCNPELRCDMFNNVLLSGGGMKFDGIKERLEKEMNSFKVNIDLINGYIKKHYRNKFINKDVVNIIHNQCGVKVNVIAPQERKYSAWIGGAIISNLSSFKKMWIGKEEYNEYGASIVHHKCTGI